jgi:hypothetical protein
MYKNSLVTGKQQSGTFEPSRISIMKRLVRQIAVLTLLLVLAQCTPTEKNDIKKGKDLRNLKQKFISLSQLEAAGFEHISAADFDLLFDGDHVYLLNMRDLRVAIYEDGKLLKVYNAPRGQGPQDMLAPKSIFFYDGDTLAIHDYSRQSIIFFDRDLNYKREQKLDIRFEVMAQTSFGLMATDPEHKHMFAFLDGQFNVVDTFVEKYDKLPFKEYFFYESMLNKEFFVGKNIVGHSHRHQINKKCKIDLYNLESRAHTISLHWEQTTKPTKKDFLKKRNLYCSSLTRKLGPYYVVHNVTIGQLSDRSSCTYDLLIFDGLGKLIYKADNLPFRILRFQSDCNDTKLYVMEEGDDKGMDYIELEDILG